MERLHALPYSVLYKFETFRRKHFTYLYVCKECARAFDSQKETEKCKFCNGGVVLLSSRKDTNLRYYCPKCEKNYVSEEKLEKCRFCGNNNIHLYEWRRLWRDVFRTKRKTLREAIKNSFVELPARLVGESVVTKTAAPATNEKKSTVQPVSDFISSFKKVRRPQEELPTE